MHWIDFSGLKVKEALLPEGWTFASANAALPAESIAGKGELLLLSMRSDALEPGTLRFVADHLNLSGSNPLRGHNNDEHGVRFPDMSEPYRVPEAVRDQALLIRAGQHPRYPSDAPEAAPLVYQTIIAKHQSKTVIALLYGRKVNAEQLLKAIQGVNHA
jgi:hypothetical protein